MAARGPYRNRRALEADPKADADLRVYRGKYLFALAHVCGLRPNDIDDLTVGDFWTLVTSTERYHRAMQGSK